MLTQTNRSGTSRATAPAGALEREQQIADVQHDIHAEVDRGDDGPDLGLHRDGREDVVVRAVERVDEEQHPEGQHRQEVAVDGPAGDRGEDEVQDGHSEGRDVQADRVVNPESAVGRSLRPGTNSGTKLPTG